MALTKVSGGILDPGINVAGIVTATGFDGPFTGGSSKNITAGIITATGLDLNGNADISGSLTVGSGGLDLNGSGDISGDLVIHGNLTANGDFTTLNTTLREVEILRVDADTTAVAGIITQRGTGDVLRLYDNTAEIFTVADGGNVTLQSTYPVFNIRGTNASATSTGTINFNLRDGNSNNRTIAKIIGRSDGNGGYGSLDFHTAFNNTNIKRMSIDKNGKVGIGTDLPDYPLDVIGSIGFSGQTRGLSQSASSPTYSFDGDSDTGMYRGNGVNILSFATAGTERLNLDADGVATFSSVTGINTGVKIQQTALNYNAGLEINATNGGQARINLKTSKSGANRAARIDFYNQNAQKWTLINDFDQNGTNDLSIRYGIDGGSWGEYLTMNPGSSVELFHSGTKKFETQADGCHIYGTYGLQVYGGLAGTNSNAQMLLYPTGTAVYSWFKGFKSDGSRSAGLTIYDGSNCYLDSTGTGSGGAVYLRAYGTGFLQFQTANAQRVKILDSGFVGIGTGNPSALLDVNKGTQANIQLKTTEPGSINSMSFAIGSATNQIYSRGANSSTPRDFIFAQGSSEVLKIDTTGNIILKDTVAQGNSLVNYIQATDVNGAGQYYFGMLSTGNQDLYIQQTKNANLRFQTNAVSRWYIDGDPGHLLPGTAGAVDIGSTSAEIGNVYIADDKSFYAGSDQNIRLYHTSSNGINHLVGHPGNMFYHSATHYFTDAAQSQLYAQFIQNSYCELRYSGAQKIKTSATGIDVTGEVATTQDYPDFRPVLDLNFMQNRTLDPRVTYTRDGTASYVDETGRLRWVGAHVPRFDHDPITGKSKGLLIEESRTNLFYAQASSYLSNIPLATYNVNANGAIIRPSDDVLAPDGSRTTTKLYWDGTYNSGGSWNQNGYARIGHATGELTAGDYIFSFFVKRGTDGRHNMDDFLGIDGSTPTFGIGHYQAVFQDFSPYYSREPKINGSTSTIQKFPNGWYRCTSPVFTSVQTWTPDNAGISHYTNASNPQKTYYEAMPHYYWGFQLEKAAYATSYIGNTIQEQATRGADITMINGENFTEFYNPVESTIVVNYTHHDGVTTSNIGSQPRVYNFRAASGSDTRIDYVSNTNYNPYIAKDGSSVASISDGVATVFDGGTNRTAVRVKEDSFATCFNGTLGTGDTSGAWNPSNAITEVSIGGQASGSANNQLSGHIQRFMYYPVGLPDSQLVTLTS